MAEEKVVVDIEKVLSYRTKEIETFLDSREPVLYALGLGFSEDPMNAKDLSFTYELHEDFKIFPTFACVLNKENIFDYLMEIKGLPQFNPMMLLHGEERIEIFRPFKAQTKYVTIGKVSDIQDKVKGMLLTFEMTSYEVDENKKKIPVASQQISLFIRKLGGFGYKGKGSKPIPKKPTRQPCTSWEVKTQPNQAILYRLNGDLNPLHIDPNMAAMGGFDKPILHGLCFFGLAARGVYEKFCNGNVNAIKAVQCRFVSHVFPGETIVYKYWKEGDKIMFSGATKERQLECIVGVVELQPQAKL